VQRVAGGVTTCGGGGSPLVRIVALGRAKNNHSGGSGAEGRLG
jgi:hypothetical protein